MGRFKAVPAVTSEFTDVAGCLASGRPVVDVLDKLGVVRPDAVTLHVLAGIGRASTTFSPGRQVSWGGHQLLVGQAGAADGAA